MSDYVARLPKRQFIKPEHVDLARRRTLPFLKHGTHYSIEHLLQEAYFQGMKDAVQAFEGPDR